jgi:TolB-like protein
MRITLGLALLMPAAAYSAPPVSTGNPSVAVFDFNSDWSLDYHVQITDAGKVFASWLAHDLALLAPITVVDAGAIEQLQQNRKFSIADSISPVEAKQVGLSLGATTLVTGRMIRSGTEVIVAAKIVSAGTGEALGTAVRGDSKTSFADMVSQLSEQVGQLVLLQQGVKQSSWAQARIVGTRKIVSTVIPNAPREDTAGVVSVDGKTIPGGPKEWTQELPIRPGAHRVVIYCYYGGSPLLYCPLTFDAMPGASYVVAYDGGRPDNSRLWLEDQSTHQPVARLDPSLGISGDNDNVSNHYSPWLFDEEGSGPYYPGGFQYNAPSFGSSPARSGGGHK